MHLSMSLHYFAGESPLDIMVSHGVGLASVYTSVWGVVDCLNQCEEFEFHFPDISKQQEIADGFKEMSGALFDNVVGAIDGILIWTNKPTVVEC
eukprot:729864-Ditylum_brightwellii.AAC.1